MESIKRLREWANGLHGVYINQIDHTITVTTGWDAPPDMDSVSLRDHISGILDSIEREVDEMWHALTIDAKPMTDENMAESGWVRLPLDAEGEYIRIGDVMEWPDCSTAEVVGIGDGTFFYVEDGEDAADWSCAGDKIHHHAPTVENVLEELLREYDRDDSELTNGEIIERFAAKLQLKEG